MNPRGYNPGKFLREWFPEQTKSIPSILIWSVVFLLDVILVVCAASKLGFGPFVAATYNLRQLLLLLYLVASLGLFAVEAFIYNKLVSLFR